MIYECLNIHGILVSEITNIFNIEKIDGILIQLASKNDMIMVDIMRIHCAYSWDVHEYW